MKVTKNMISGQVPGTRSPGNFRGISRWRIKYMQFCFLIIASMLIPASCRNKNVLNKSRAEKALRVFDSELIGKALGIMQTDGWDVFLGLLRPDSIPLAGRALLPGSSHASGNQPIPGTSPVSCKPPVPRNSHVSVKPPVPGSNLIDLSYTDNIFSSALLVIPVNFNQEYVKKGEKVCSVNFYFKMNPDSSFYVRKVLFIKPISLEVKCFYTRGRLPRSGRIYLVISAWDTSVKFMGGRISAQILAVNKGFLQVDELHAEVSLFDLFFSADADFSPMKPGSRKTWTDAIKHCRTEVSDNSSGQYLGQLILEDKQKGKQGNFLFVFSDGSREPASAYFSWLSRLVSPD